MRANTDITRVDLFVNDDTGRPDKKVVALWPDDSVIDEMDLQVPNSSRPGTAGTLQGTWVITNVSSMAVGGKNGIEVEFRFEM